MVNDVFAQVCLKLITDADRLHSNRCVRLLSTHFAFDNPGRAFERLQACGVTIGAMFFVYRRERKEVVPVVRGTKNVFKLSDTMAIKLTHFSVSHQHPARMPAMPALHRVP